MDLASDCATLCCSWRLSYVTWSLRGSTLPEARTVHFFELRYFRDLSELIFRRLGIAGGDCLQKAHWLRVVGSISHQDPAPHIVFHLAGTANTDDSSNASARTLHNQPAVRLLLCREDSLLIIVMSMSWKGLPRIFSLAARVCVCACVCVCCLSSPNPNQPQQGQFSYC